MPAESGVDGNSQGLLAGRTPPVVQGEGQDPGRQHRGHRQEETQPQNSFSPDRVSLSHHREDEEREKEQKGGQDLFPPPDLEELAEFRDLRLGVVQCDSPAPEILFLADRHGRRIHRQLQLADARMQFLFHDAEPFHTFSPNSLAICRSNSLIKKSRGFDRLPESSRSQRVRKYHSWDSRPRWK